MCPGDGCSTQSQPTNQHSDINSDLVFDDVLRQLTFFHALGGLTAATERYVRKVGRPRHAWAGMMLQEAVKQAGSYTNLQTKTQISIDQAIDQEEWNTSVRNWMSQPKDATYLVI